VTLLGALGSRLEERLKSRSATVGVVGLGYVGLPLTVAFARAGFRVVPVSSTQVAEMVKLFENTFRSVNIALVNELAVMCRRLGMSVWEVIAAAATKPFGFMAFFLGPGIGGHCLPSDPHYLSWRTRLAGYEAKFITFADEITLGDFRHVIKL
jgi:UDP-N-acetyl-D-glucosamine dehydrogenase